MLDRPKTITGISPASLGARHERVQPSKKLSALSSYSLASSLEPSTFRCLIYAWLKQSFYFARAFIQLARVNKRSPSVLWWPDFLPWFYFWTFLVLPISPQARCGVVLSVHQSVGIHRTVLLKSALQPDQQPASGSHSRILLLVW